MMTDGTKIKKRSLSQGIMKEFLEMKFEWNLQQKLHTIHEQGQNSEHPHGRGFSIENILLNDAVRLTSTACTSGCHFA